MAAAPPVPPAIGVVRAVCRLLIFGAALAITTAARAGNCAGDCDGDATVSIGELVRGVGIALGIGALIDCPSLDEDGDGHVSIAELVRAVGTARHGCPLPTPSPSPSPGADPRPNVVVLLLDDARADGLDRMPVLQAAIAAQGVRFTNAFAPNSVCAPSRASLLTGQYALHHGTRAVGGVLGGADSFRLSGADRRTLAVLLHEAGYETGLFGKYLNDYTGAEATAGPGGTYYVPPGWSRWRAMASPEHYGGVLGWPYGLVDEGGTLTPHALADDADYATDVLGTELRDFISAAAAESRPFFALWSIIAPHIDAPDLLPQPSTRYLGAFTDLPPARPPNWRESDVSDKPRWIQSLPDTPDRVLLTDAMRRRAYESLLAVDEELRLLLVHLARLGLDRRTLIVVTSDNGVGWGEHRLFFQLKECPYDVCLRVPLLIRYPPASAVTVSAPVLNIDLAPTILELAGVPPPVDVDGRSFAAVLAGGTPPPRDDFLIEHWRWFRLDRLQVDGQVADGDRVRLFHGDPWLRPRPSAVFEFDAGDGVTAGAVAVPIGGDADASVAALERAIGAAVPTISLLPFPADHAFAVIARRGEEAPYFWIEVDQGGVLHSTNLSPDYFGVRDVAAGLTYVEHETGEVELYDLAADPWQMQNVAGDPAHAAVQASLAARLAALLAAPP